MQIDEIYFTNINTLKKGVFNNKNIENKGFLKKIALFLIKSFLFILPGEGR
jgi:hypothetical protein